VAQLSQPSRLEGAPAVGEAGEPDPIRSTPEAAVSEPVVGRFRPQSQDDLAPSGTWQRAEANLAALELLQRLREQGREATSAERGVLARWGSWGAVPAIFDEAQVRWQPQRDRLRALLSEEEFAAARRTVLNAHYTDPAYVDAMWQALERLGFQGGRVLEPGCGAGTFIGMAPAAAQMVGVELDPTSAGIAAALYPHAQVRAESFAQTKIPRGYFDAAIGNVPFAKLVLHDPAFNAGNHSIHNHFILKSLALVRPGGVAAFLTSRFTMDATNPAARREMHQLADLLGAVRLPAQAHRRAAGTEVVTDLLIFRRRLPGQEAGEQRWEYARPVQIDEVQIGINDYFHRHPERMLGQASIQHGMYNAQDLRVVGDLQRLPEQLQEQLVSITDAAVGAGLTMTAAAQEQTGAALAPVARADEDLWEGHLSVDEAGTGFTQLTEGVLAPIKVPRAQFKELRTLLQLRDQARALLSMEAGSVEDTPQLEAARTELAACYRDYVAKYGPINRVKITDTGRLDSDGDPIIRRAVPPVMRTLRTDPFYALITSLERYDEHTGTAAPSTILSERVVHPKALPQGADTAEEALALSMDVHGHPDLDYIAHLLGVDSEQAREQLRGMVFSDPETSALLPAAEYLSGNVIIKLERAREAAATDDAFTENVQALEQVIPTPLGADEIEPQIGAVWVSPEDYAQFLSELIEAPVTVSNPYGTIWDVRAVSNFRAISEWGTRRVPAARILETSLKQQVVTVVDDVDGTRVPNPTATEEAREKQAAMQERFAEWVWEDPARTARLVAEYNRRFNGIVLRDYTKEGERLRLPGLARSFTPRPHQRAAVARIINEPAVGLFHEVGAGKTAEMVMGVMELRRLGLARKPVVVVPNHMLEQFTAEWLQCYPRARLLAASVEDLQGDKRRRFVALAATNDWDAVVMTRTAFQRIPVSKTLAATYEARELEAMRAALSAATEKNLTVKRLERKLATEEERIKAKLDKAEDPGITFEQTGIDYVMVDEAHDYKNLRTVSGIQGAAINGSIRATDLHMKLEHLRSTRGRRVATFATATPLANSVTEAHVMQRYLRPDLLQAAGVHDFDSWAGTFGQTVTEIEMGVAGGFRQKTRFAKFKNVPEMLRMWHTFADVKTAEDLKLPVPDLTVRQDGQRLPVTALLEPSDDVTGYVQHLAARADLVKSRAVDPSEDNMLKISSDGRKAALDMRLIDATFFAHVERSKVEAAAAKIVTIWEQNRHRTYHDDAGEVSPVPGALQIVFCDLGTPSQDWNVYDELHRHLVAAGIPAEGVRFIHEAKTDNEKARLFAACRSGQVAVLIGSTQKMGVGTNIQRRAVALHHLDCPWRPADLAQREGRIVRQGNENPEVSIYRWVVEGSFDAYSWQTVERKAKFISQVMRGRLDVREVEDIGDTALSYAEVKALASGNPLLIDREEASAALARLERLERAHRQNLAGLGASARDSGSVLDGAERDLPLLQQAAEQVRTTKGDAFRAVINGTTYTDRVQAGNALGQWVTANQHRISGHYYDERPLGVVAQLGGHTIEAATRRPLFGGGPCFALSIKDVPRTSWTVEVEHLQTGAGEGGLVRQLENRVAGIADLIPKTVAEREDAQRRLLEIEAAKARPFKYVDELTRARTRLSDIETRIKDREREDSGTEPDQEPPTTEAPAPLPAAHQRTLDRAANGLGLT
jgi:N12 class adenine-specific DNA methylase/SAM-dependent methyltransferase